MLMSRLRSGAGCLLGACGCLAGQVHRAVAGRVFGQLPVAGAPVRVIHDTIAAGVYLTIRGSGMVAGVVSGEVAAQIGAGGGSAGSVAGTPAGNLALSALNALTGD